jgi:hypothetical protein
VNYIFGVLHLAVELNDEIIFGLVFGEVGGLFYGDLRAEIIITQ